MAEENLITDQKPQQDNSAEVNFAKLRKKLEATENEKEAFRLRAAELERERLDLIKNKTSHDDDDSDDEPYVDRKRLKKELSRHGEDVKKEIQNAVQGALEEERRSTYLKENPDFNNILSEETLHRFVEGNPGLAGAILRMPDGFERQKLVYESIKAIDNLKKTTEKSSIQSKIDANQRSPYFMPSSSASPPFGGGMDPKAAYARMQELKSRVSL